MHDVTLSEAFFTLTLTQEPLRSTWFSGTCLKYIRLAFLHDLPVSLVGLCMDGRCMFPSTCVWKASNFKL